MIEKYVHDNDFDLYSEEFFFWQKDNSFNLKIYPNLKVKV